MPYWVYSDGYESFFDISDLKRKELHKIQIRKYISEQRIHLEFDCVFLFFKEFRTVVWRLWMLLYKKFVHTYTWCIQSTDCKCCRCNCSCYGTYFTRFQLDISVDEKLNSQWISHINKISFRFTGNTRHSVNLGSYNYLGFAENSGPCSNQAIKSIEQYGVSTCSTRRELGTQKYMQDLEKLMAEYLNVEDCITFGMGFATNALNIPAIFGKVDEDFYDFLYVYSCK